MAFLRIPIAFFTLEELFLNVFFNSGEYVGLISFTFLTQFLEICGKVAVDLAGDFGLAIVSEEILFQYFI